MTHASLFSGGGGFDLPAEWMGWENIFHCEIEPFGQRVLKYYWPNAYAYADITKSDFSRFRGKIDVLTGGFPCQPFSVAGKRAGTEDTRHLWPEMLRAIREIRPRWIVGENVRGITSWNGGVVFDAVQTDLENEGYAVIPLSIPACSVDAPHRRERIWFVAYDPNADRVGLQKAGTEQQAAGAKQCGELGGNAANPAGARLERGFWRSAEGTRPTEHSEADATYTHVTRLQRGAINGSVGEIRENRSEQPAGCVPPNWHKFPTQSPICCGNDGVPTGLVGITVPKHRNESIKAFGNAVVPQVVYQIFKTIELHEMLY